ncbi:P-loop containing nucleoside triphosphate hydrolase protein [Pisolithus microcarpus]|nr:P-loop containing nucleoside triphosphate hydrolase protein [Pisolithus microcarpus]
MLRPYYALRCNRIALRKLVPIARGFASEPHDEPSDIRNMALVAHIDSGKTTLTESILHKSSYISTPGSVDTGSTITDFLPAERERGITIQSASVPVKWKHWSFNLIDTPGHADFGMEVESASRVVDGAVVLIDSVEGVEAQTKAVWGQLSRYNVTSRLVFVNKLDRPGASFRASLLSLIAHGLHSNPLAITLPIASMEPGDYARAEPGIVGLVDLVKWQLWEWTVDGECRNHSLPLSLDTADLLRLLPKEHPIIPHLIPARVALLENLAMYSEELMDKLLALPSEPSFYLQIQPQDIIPHLRRATLGNQVLPVLCGSALEGIGTELIMDYLLASPLDVRTEDENVNGPLRLLAWKVAWDQRKGWMTFVRVYSGCLRSQSVLFNVNTGQKEKVSKLLLLYASEAQEVDYLPYGSVGVLLGLRFTRTGDTLMSGRGQGKLATTHSVRGVVLPPAVMSVSVIPNSHSDLEPVQEAIQALIRTDPSVRMDVQDGQILVHALGALHLEIIEGRLRDEWRANFEFGKRQVSYRESLNSNMSSDLQEWSTEVAGKVVTAKISLSISPLAASERGDPAFEGNLVLDNKGKPVIAPDASPDQLLPLTYLARGISSALSSSPHTLLPYSHVKVQIRGFNLPRDAPPSVLAGASSAVMRNILKRAGMGPILEPYIKLRISVYEDSIGKVIRDIMDSGGEVLDLASDTITVSGDEGGKGQWNVETTYIPPVELSPSSTPSVDVAGIPRSKRTVHAVAPLSQMLDYSTRLRALSAGHGTFDMTNAGFREVSESRKMAILRELGRA